LKYFFPFLLLILLLLLVQGVCFALDTFDKAQIYLENGDSDRAIQILKPLLNSEIENELAQTVEVLYAIYSERGLNTESIQVLKAYIDKFPQTQPAYLYRYWIAKIEEENKNYDESLKILNEIAFQYPSDIGDPFTIQQQAMEDVAFHQGNYFNRYPNAIQTYLTYLSEFPDYEEKPRILLQIASLYEKMGEIEKALEYYQKIIEEETKPYYLDLAEMRIDYLHADPVWARESPAVLIKELREAFINKNYNAIASLGKKGDFWAGQMFSEYEIVQFSQIIPYFKMYLPQSQPYVHPAEKKERE